MRKHILAFFVLIFSLDTEAQVIELKENWKFITGDSLQWAKPTYNDAHWRPIKTGSAWENQGYKEYDGYAWYRVKVFIPEELRNFSSLKDEVLVNIGGIDNFNQCFLNGFLIGQNLETVTDDTLIGPIDKGQASWRDNKIYKLKASDPRILWGKINCIAVRVLDINGNGGMWSGTPSISVVDVDHYLKLSVRENSFIIDQPGGKTTKTISITNTSERYTFNGKVNIHCLNATKGITLLDSIVTVTLHPNGCENITFSIKNNFKDISPIYYDFKVEGSGKTFKEKEYLPYLLTPSLSDRPLLHNVSRYGVRSGHPVFYKVPATGVEPKTYRVKNLPDGLVIDSKTGVISGTIKHKGEYILQLKVSNSVGEDTKELKIIVGDKICLTPPMGWNTYYCYWNEVKGDQVLNTTRLMKESGLIDHGYSFINIDDGWSGERDKNGNIAPNEKFGSIKEIGDYVHQNGLKFGIYNSPGKRTCGGFTGTYGHEAQDIKTYADWEVDYLKYDWCSYDDLGDVTKLSDLKKPYFLMKQKLDSVNRDIIFSLCQYGLGDVWKWGREVGGNLWRTTFDVTDSWESLHNIAFQQYKHIEFAGPGGWNDPDMLLCGWFNGGSVLHPSKLTFPEQYTQFTLWSLLSAPLMLSCELSKLDPVTRSIISNDEVISIDQDGLGKPAKKILDKNDIQIYIKELENGQKAIGVFNLGEKDTSICIHFDELGLQKSLIVRNVWEQRDLGRCNKTLGFFVSSHGCALFKISSSAGNGR
jgi:alpha-galactosidase